LKIIHTADLHLGRSFSSLGEDGKRIRDALKDSLRKIIHLAIEDKADVILITGDLFESNNVSRQLIRFVVGEFKRSKIPILILPGTHDCYDSTSVYKSSEFTSNLSNVHIFQSDQSETIILESLNIAVHAHANRSKQGGVHPLAGLVRDPTAKYNIALAHGSVTIPGKFNPNDYLIDLEEIQRSGMNYVALGHWHRFVDFAKAGGIPACYCGAPETMSFEDADESGHVLMVNFEGDEPRVEKRRIGKYKWKEIDIDVSVYSAPEEIKQEILKHSGSNIVLRAKLHGLVKSPEVCYFEALDEVADEFAHLEINTDGVRLAYPGEPSEAFPLGTIGYNFVKAMRARIHSASNEEEKLLYEETLAYGIAYLKGQLGVRR
jgi:DNA repair exonuclease SbcCD nuclease subunit